MYGIDMDEGRRQVAPLIHERYDPIVQPHGLTGADVDRAWASFDYHAAMWQSRSESHLAHLIHDHMSKVLGPQIDAIVRAKQAAAEAQARHVAGLMTRVEWAA